RLLLAVAGDEGDGGAIGEQGDGALDLAGGDPELGGDRGGVVVSCHHGRGSLLGERSVVHFQNTRNRPAAGARRAGGARARGGGNRDRGGARVHRRSATAGRAGGAGGGGAGGGQDRLRRSRAPRRHGAGARTRLRGPGL